MSRDDHILHEDFSDAFFHLRPDAPRELRIFEVDAGDPDDANVVMRAAVFKDDVIAGGEMIGDPVTVIIAKKWLREDLAWGCGAESERRDQDDRFGMGELIAVLIGGAVGLLAVLVWG